MHCGGNMAEGKCERDVLTFLSMNSRASIKSIAKELKCSEASVGQAIRDLNEKYGLKYTISLSMLRLNYTDYIALGKFKKKPSENEIEELKNKLESNPCIQFAAMLEGEYDIVAYYNAKKDELEDGIWSTEIELLKFQDYAPVGNSIEWTISWIDLDYGNVAIRDEFIDYAEKNEAKGYKNWESTDQHKKFIVIKELLKDSSQSFNDMDRRYGFSQNTSYNIAKKLFEDKIITWYTIDMKKPGIDGFMLYYLRIVNEWKFLKHREKFMEHLVLKTNSHINRYSLIADINTPRGIILFSPVEGHSIKGIEEELKRIDGTELSAMKVKKMLFGGILLRRFDNDYSSQQSVLVEQYWRTHQKVERRKYYKNFN